MTIVFRRNGCWSCSAVAAPLNLERNMRRLCGAALSATCFVTCVHAQSNAHGPLVTPSGKLQFVRGDRDFATIRSTSENRGWHCGARSSASVESRGSANCGRSTARSHGHSGGRSAQTTDLHGRIGSISHAVGSSCSCAAGHLRIFASASIARSSWGFA